ncbi:PH domain-containing protein [Nonomuraea sp. K274]|uniref:PH domain-containing protein n=1 Tax=Nonomuraea cypriaca TaxID=1187855 RepID=A0A931EXN6_9ACTN|nr:PH domain-containing protein [Nonomuraea cypriaca]MBF8184341.1 PH domain-containing protein [Nonomuraea cypriaca]
MTYENDLLHPACAEPRPWGRLSGRLILVNLIVLVAPPAMLLISLLVTGGETNLQILITLGSLAITCLVIGGAGMMRLATTRYRITGERFELHSGLFFRSRRSIPVGRVRGIDLTAGLVYRIFGLTTLRIDTGGQSAAAGRGVRLDGIAKADAAALRARIIELRDAGHVRSAAESDLISELDRSWLRYGPLTVWGVGGVLAAAGSVYRTLHEMKIDPLELGVVKDLVHRFGSVPLWYGVLMSVLVIVALGMAGSTAAFVENWSGYELRRGDGGIFQIRRGLLATRSVTIEERRLRGVELVEPIPLRWAGGAKLNAVAGGLGDQEENRRRRALTPPVPRAEALRIAAEVLPAVTHSESEPLSRVGLAPHPRAALRGRINRALAAAVLIAAVPVGLGLWLGPALVAVGCVTGLVLALILVALAYDAYRTLGNGMRGRYLVAASGAFTHRTVALRQEGIIGWTITRSAFQRRTGLLTLGATTSAGDGVYKVRDVSMDHGLALAEAAVPRLLAPFIEHERQPRTLTRVSGRSRTRSAESVK